MTDQKTSDAPATETQAAPPADGHPVLVIKRDGSTRQAFDVAKMVRAVTRASAATDTPLEDREVRRVVDTALGGLLTPHVTVEDIQNSIEVALMRRKAYGVAKAFILYRDERARSRLARERTHPDPKAVADYVHAGKYAQHRADLHRRETYEETVARVEGMHLRRFPALAEKIRWAFDMVREKRVLPSMRSMQFGGAAVEANHNRQYNCSFSHVNRVEVFGEALFLLLSGCGVGYSIQFEHVEQLPSLAPKIDSDNVVHHVVGDTIEGWADAVTALVRSYVAGYHVEFAYHRIRAKGTPLKTSGGKAPGYRPLKQTLDRIRGVLDGARGRRLRPIEAHRVMCHAADCVLSGGIRRSALIALFSLDDSEMMNAKVGAWYASDPWFANANNSAVIVRSEAREKAFKRVFTMTRQWGEPGFLFTDNAEYGTNPCGEIGLDPTLVRDGVAYSGWAFCNLCEINGALATTREAFLSAARAATFIGTLQASYTDFPYLGPVSEEIARRDALLGVGITGMLDSPAITCDPGLQREVASLVQCWNAEDAATIGIKPAARLTCVKPSGTAALELGGVASGIHPHHARRYIKRVIADELEPVFQAFREKNPHMCVRMPSGKWVIEFAVEAPAGATVKADLGAIEFLEIVRSTQGNWVVPGTTARSREISPGLSHNVSNTVVVKPGEWDEVAAYLWKHRASFTGVALLPDTGDKDYAFSPNEAVTTPADEARWAQIVEHYTPLDYAALVEEDDATNLTGEVACAGGACAI